jgi:hypothetical protein
MLKQAFIIYNLKNNLDIIPNLICLIKSEQNFMLLKSTQLSHCFRSELSDIKRVAEIVWINFIIILRKMLTSAPGALFKHFK